MLVLLLLLFVVFCVFRLCLALGVSALQFDVCHFEGSSLQAPSGSANSTRFSPLLLDSVPTRLSVPLDPDLPFPLLGPCFGLSPFTSHLAGRLYSLALKPRLWQLPPDTGLTCYQLQPLRTLRALFDPAAASLTKPHINI